MRDYYIVLGVAPDAPLSEIKAAYRRQAARLHPDRNPSPQAAQHFCEAQEAHDVLCDPKARESYDRLRQTQLVDDPLRVALEIWMAYVRKTLGATETH
ncbi:MAG TPA: DnaJ domain-containing protein [Rhodocyclaceae bacterium]|nr:DnaJ domain-containing protein [Rhodocyclaceae bacterium]